MSNFPNTEIPVISIGICTLPLEENIQKLGIYNSPSVWVYCAHNGVCYHKGKGQLITYEFLKI